MKKLITAIGLSLSLSVPVIAASTEPEVKPHSFDALGCMILLECKDGIEKLTPDSKIFEAKEFNLFREEIKRILTALDKLNVPVYLAPDKYFPPLNVGIYKPSYNRFFINSDLVKNPMGFLATLRHEGWHTVQDCMGGGLQTSFMAQVHQDNEIPAWVMKMTRMLYEPVGMAKAVPWEADANWAKEQTNVTAEKLEMCAKGPLWEQMRPTPQTMEWLIGCGWMKPQEGYKQYSAGKKSEYCVEGKH